MKKILVTGGLGFQGFNIVQALLQRGDHVTIVNTPSPRARYLADELDDANSLSLLIDGGGLRVVWSSITDQEIMEKVVPGHDAVLHLAAWASVDQSLDRPWPPFEINALGALTVLEAIRRFADRPVRTIVASTCEVYGPVRQSKLFHDSTGNLYTYSQDEDTPMMPRSPYAATKIAQDRLAYAYAVSYGIDITILRPCNVYGPWQRYGSVGAVIPTFVRNAMMKEPLHITGGGQQSREFIHVSDVVSAYLKVLDTAPTLTGEAYNVGTGETRMIRQLAEVIAKNPNQIEYSDARAADVTGFLLNSTKFRDTFDWQPRVKFDDGLREYIQWVESRNGEM